MENDNQTENKMIQQEKILHILTIFCLSLSLVSTITYMIYTILTSSNIMNQIFSIIGVIILAIFSVLYVIVGMFARSKNVKMFLMIGSLLLAIYSIFQIISGITAPKDLVLDFTGKDIKEVVYWAEERNILIEQEFQSSDTVEQYHIISQDVEAGTPTKNIKRIKFIISDGIDINTNTEVTNMVGWQLDDVITFIDENHLTNVTVNFEFSDTVPKDIIISQDTIREIKRNEPITLVSSLGKEEDLKSVTMDNLVGLDTFHALIYCGRNHLDCSIEYVYGEEEKEDIVLSQSIKKWTVIDPKEQREIILTIARKTGITVPDFQKMSITGITTWATNNRLKIEIEEEYDDTIKSGKLISSNYIKGNIVQVDDTIKIIISKGPLYMPKFTTIEHFIKWSEENNIPYDIHYQYSDTKEKGALISSSHKENQLVKNNEMIELIISQGGNTFIPNIMGMTKEEAMDSCNSANINCKFTYQDGNEEYNTVIKQSMRKGSNVPIGTTITITLGP